MSNTTDRFKIFSSNIFQLQDLSSTFLLGIFKAIDVFRLKIYQTRNFCMILPHDLSNNVSFLIFFLRIFHTWDLFIILFLRILHTWDLFILIFLGILRARDLFATLFIRIFQIRNLFAT